MLMVTTLDNEAIYTHNPLFYVQQRYAQMPNPNHIHLKLLP